MVITSDLVKDTESSGPMKFSLTITTPEIQRAVPVALLDGPFERRLATAAALGYDGVELMTARPNTIDAAAVRAQVERAGLEVAAVSSGAQSSLEKVTLLGNSSLGFERLVSLVRFAAEVGAPVLTIGSFRGRLRIDEDADEGRARLVELLRRAAATAQEYGTRLVIEPLNRYETDLVFNVGQGLALIEEVSHNHLGILFDSFHANIEEASLRGSLSQVAAAGRLWHVHIADSNRLAPGQGHLDFPDIFRTLAELGYMGYCSAELLAQPDPYTAAVQTIEYCRTFRAY